MLKQPRARILHKKTWGMYCLLSMEAPAIAAASRPGQFVMVRPGEYPLPLLRRPFSIHCATEGRVDIFFFQAGTGTALLSRKEEGDTLDILGPLGKGFRVEESLEGLSTALIGGGRGIAPLYFLARELRGLGALPRVYYGGKTRHDLPLKQKFEDEGFRILCSTEDGSLGFKGMVTRLFEEELENHPPARIYACGPEAMMADLARKAESWRLAVECSLESVMGCGFGACWGCVRKIRTREGEEWVKICEEGPVFDAGEVLWEDGGK